jgi:hypothetical protein
MGQSGPFLKVAHLAEGLHQLLTLLFEDQKKFAHYGALTARCPSAVPTVSSHEFPDGTLFTLLAFRDAADPMDSPCSLKMIWLNESRRFDVLVPSRFGPGVESPPEEHAIFAALMRPDFREIRSNLDRYAMPRLLLPAKWNEETVLALLAQLVLFAARAGELDKKADAPVVLFREYCSRAYRHHLKELRDSEKNAVADRVFERLFLRGEAGRGFMAPARAGSFRRYIDVAIRKTVSEMRPASEQRLSKPESSIAAAAAHLGVSFATVWRRTRQLGFKEWSPEAWTAINHDVESKAKWRLAQNALEETGLSPSAARKAVYRARKAGKQPMDVVNQLRRKRRPSEG